MPSVEAEVTERTDRGKPYSAAGTEIVLKYKPLPKQALFHQSKAKFRVYSGGLGGGKTKCGAAESILQSLWYRNNLGLVGRMTYPELRDTTRREILEFPVVVDGEEMELVRSPWVKRFNRSENVLEFINGSSIVFRALDGGFDKIKSLNLGWAYVDELTECPEEIFVGLMGRLRRHDTHHTLFGTTNPEGRDWVWRRFIGNPQPDHFIVKTSSSENTHLPKGYVETLRAQYPEEWVKRYVEGSFDTFEGLVYKEFADREPYVVSKVVPKESYRFVAVDHGFRNPTAVLWLAVDRKGDVHVYDEFYASGRLVSEIAEIIKAKTGDDLIRTYLIDPSCANRDGKTGRSVIDEFGEYGLYFDGANNDVRAGINHVQEYLKLREGGPRLTISRDCVHLRQELQTYRWKDIKIGEDKDKPEKPHKKDDHAADALRYGINYIYQMPEQKTGVKGWRKWMGIDTEVVDWRAA